jgi:hypothetical protein
LGMLSKDNFWAKWNRCISFQLPISWLVFWLWTQGRKWLQYRKIRQCFSFQGWINEKVTLRHKLWGFRHRKTCFQFFCTGKIYWTQAQGCWDWF